MTHNISIQDQLNACIKHANRNGYIISLIRITGNTVAVYLDNSPLYITYFSLIRSDYYELITNN